MKRATNDMSSSSPIAGGECPFGKRMKTAEQAVSSEGATAATATNAAAGCPYAQAMIVMQESNRTLAENSESSNFGNEIPPSLPGVVELKECPAFTNSCPFKDAHSPEEVSHRLAQIPSSHLQGTTHRVLLKTLAYYHNSSNNNGHAAVSTVVPTCPVKNFLPQDWSFNRAMEDYSLASIMSRLAEQYEDDISEDGVVVESNKVLGDNLDDYQDHDDEHHRDESRSTVTSSSFETLGSLVPPTSASYKESPSSGTRRLSEALKTGTAAAHEAAESVHFVKNFIRGKIDRDLYALLVAQLYHVYKHLELLLNEHAPGHFAPCHFPRELERLPALKEDVEFWHAINDTSQEEPEVSPATQDYLDRLEKLGKEDPLLLLAHAYTRYLGDLSGGKILGRVARRALKLDKDGEGLAFYQFPLVESAKKFKDNYRNCLNELLLDDAQVQDIVKEANIAFLLNMRLFEELDVLGGVPSAKVRDLEEVYSIAAENADRPEENNKQLNEAPCPFAKAAPGTSGGGSSSTLQKRGVCPWPFILLHDPVAGLKHHETWLVIIGVTAAYFYSKYIAFSD